MAGAEKRRKREASTKREAGLARRLAFVRVDVSFALVDALLISAAYTAALMLRFVDLPTGVPPRWWMDFAWFLPVIVAVHLVANIAFGTYGHLWEHASVAEAKQVVISSLAAGTVLVLGVVAARQMLDIAGPLPIWSLALGSLLALMLMGAVRFRTRLFSFNREVLSAATARRVLIVGTGRPAANLARHRIVGGLPIQIVGFVRVDAGPTDRRLAGLPILGPIEAVPRLIHDHGIHEVIVASRDGAHVVQRLVDLCMSVDVRLRIMPDIDTILEDDARVQDVRDLKPEDLLARPAVSTDLARVGETLRGRAVLVTGAGGSIGSELVAQIIRFEPGAMLVLDHDETHLHEAMEKWSGSGVPLVPILCDIRDRTRVLRAFDEHRPEVVFHAAAHKHVPILEACPEEAVKTNVLGTEYLLEASRRSGVSRFVLISTDKACEPISIMGASKRLAEMLVQSAAASSTQCVYSAVRFGNVLASRGSVVPTFVKQIKRGGPVTVTDPDMTRYFMTIGEAVELVLQASAISQGGELLVLDMGEPVKIVDLAHRLIRMAGLVPGRDIEVVFTGPRPGEKLHEVISTNGLAPSMHPRVHIADEGRPDAGRLTETVNRLVRVANAGDRQSIRETLITVTGARAGSSTTIDPDLEFEAPRATTG